MTAEERNLMGKVMSRMMRLLTDASEHLRHSCGEECHTREEIEAFLLWTRQVIEEQLVATKDAN